MIIDIQDRATLVKQINEEMGRQSKAGVCNTFWPERKSWMVGDSWTQIGILEIARVPVEVCVYESQCSPPRNMDPGQFYVKTDKYEMINSDEFSDDKLAEILLALRNWKD